MVEHQMALVDTRVRSWAQARVLSWAQASQGRWPSSHPPAHSVPIPGLVKPGGGPVGPGPGRVGAAGPCARRAARRCGTRCTPLAASSRGRPACPAGSPRARPDPPQAGCCAGSRQHMQGACAGEVRCHSAISNRGIHASAARGGGGAFTQGTGRARSSMPASRLWPRGRKRRCCQ
jgi:hypothetical protein